MSPGLTIFLRGVEFAILFLGLPSLFAFARLRLPAIPALWLLTAYCLAVLGAEGRLRPSILWAPESLTAYLPSILILFLAVALVIAWAVRRWAPATFLSLPRQNPVFWLLLMVLYPVLSVYPQGIVYRVFVFDRFHDLFPSPCALVVASALAFAYVHVIFRNRIAVGLTFLGGMLFALRYQQSHSLLVSSFEHALYGCLMFTIGLGRSFYHGATRASQVQR